VKIFWQLHLYNFRDGLLERMPIMKKAALTAGAVPLGSEANLIEENGVSGGMDLLDSSNTRKASVQKQQV
jgi:hypothetical protein